MIITIDLQERYLMSRDLQVSYVLDDVKDRGFKSRFVVKDTINADMTGSTAEAAWAQLMDIPYVYKPYNPLQDDVAGVQIRSSKCRNGHLMIYKKDVPGIYVLGIVNNDYTSVKFVGWSTYELVVHPANYKTQLGTYTLAIPAYCAKQSELKSFLDWPPRNEAR